MFDKVSSETVLGPLSFRGENNAKKLQIFLCQEIFLYFIISKEAVA